MQCVSYIFVAWRLYQVVVGKAWMNSQAVLKRLVELRGILEV